LANATSWRLPWRRLPTWRGSAIRGAFGSVLCRLAYVGGRLSVRRLRRRIVGEEQFDKIAFAAFE
jgi:hypothetical protein